MDPQKPRGRGARILEALQRARSLQPGGDAPSTEQSAPGPSGDAPEPVKPRGRAALLNKLKELHLGGPSKTPVVEPPTVSIAPKPATVIPVVKEEPVERKAVSFQGTSGQSIYITANYINLSIDKNKGVFEYEVRFDEPVDAKHARIKMLNANMEALGGVKMFDGGSCLYLPIRLPQERTTFRTPHPNSEEIITMHIIYKKQKKYEDCLHLFNVLFKRVMSALQYSRVNRNYYDSKASKIIPQHKLEILPGYAIAIDDYEGGLMLCLDTQHRVLRTSTVLEYLRELQHSFAAERFRTEAIDNIIGSVVITKYNNKTYIVDDILWEKSPRDVFTSTSTGKDISFMDYFQQHYGLEVTEPSQPMLLHVMKRKVPGQAKEEDLKICLVPEFCNLTGLTDAMRNDFKVMKDVAAFTRITPHQRMNSLKQYLENVRRSPKAQQILNDWGVKIENATIDLNARVLGNEVIMFGNNGSFQTNAKADWSGPVSKHTVTGPVDLSSWVLVYTERDQTIASEFATNMTRLSNSIGCRISPPRMCKVRNDRTSTYNDACNEYINENVQCIVFICPTARNDLYSIIKKVTLVQKPIGSQVVLSRNLSNQKKVRTVTLKIALQINCKLGGSLWALRIPVKYWMVVGIDVYHSPGSKISWGAMVCSTNDSFTSYYTRVIAQEKELGDAFKMPFLTGLINYKKKMGRFPDQIVVYRDGVGDGQIEHLKLYEVQQFLDVIKQLEVPNTNLCYVVVQKRINTRLISNDSCGNPAPGTIVDGVITRKHFADFFLVPQSVTQGTVTPIHYIVIYNSGNLKPDHVQKLTYKMCHLYYNWCGTIRVPAPCQYAHKVAFLIGQFVGKEPADALCDKLYYL